METSIQIRYSPTDDMSPRQPAIFRRRASPSGPCIHPSLLNRFSLFSKFIFDQYIPHHLIDFHYSPQKVLFSTVALCCLDATKTSKEFKEWFLFLLFPGKKTNRSHAPHPSAPGTLLRPQQSEIQTIIYCPIFMYIQPEFDSKFLTTAGDINEASYNRKKLFRTLFWFCFSNINARQKKPTREFLANLRAWW